MKKRNQLNFVMAGILLLLFILYTTALLYIDVKPIGPNGSSVAFSTLNKWAADRLGVNMVLYHITDWAGILVIFLALWFGVLGLIQFIKRGSLKRVDHSILVLGGFYLLVMAAYVFFEFYVVNYRPVLIENVLEASYPSSTTMLVMCVMPTSMMQFHRLIKNRILKKTVNAVCIAFTAFTVLGRVFSGVHWVTDIFGGALLSAALIMLYYAVDKYIRSRKR